MEAAILIALLYGTAVTVYAMRVSGSRRLWEDEARAMRALATQKVAITYGAGFGESPQQRHALFAAGAAQVSRASKPKRRK